MKVLFVHNIRMKKDEKNNLYTHGSYNEEVWKRYLTFSKELSIISRKDNTSYTKKYAMKNFQMFDSEKIKNIEIYNSTKSVKTFMNFKKRFKNNKIIEKAVLENDFIIVRLPCGMGYDAINYAKKHKKPYLIEVVACPWDSLWNHSIKGKILAPISYFRLKNFVKNAPYVVYVTNEFLQKRYPTRGKNTNCSNVSLTELNEEVLIKRLERIEKDKNKIILGTTAAVDVRFKGQQYIIEALGKLKNQGTASFEYQLVGSGNQSYLKSVAKKNNVENQVKFLGPMTHKDVFEWLEKIDIYVQPSKQEGLPRSLIEAMSKGLPSFGARTGGIPELIEDQYIFSNSKKNIEEICEILNSYDSKKMEEQSKRNFIESLNYEKEIIEKRRQSFFMHFKNNS